MMFCIDCARERLLDSTGRCRPCAVAEQARIERLPAIARELRRRAKVREYAQRPEVKAKQREYAQRPGVKAKHRDYMREWARRKREAVNVGA